MRFIFNYDLLFINSDSNHDFHNYHLTKTPFSQVPAVYKAALHIACIQAVPKIGQAWERPPAGFGSVIEFPVHQWTGIDD
jgi:hypothetical protein